MSRGRLIFVNRVYWPDESATAQLLHDLARALAARGHRVLVLTASAAEAPRQETQNGVMIQRLGTARPNRRGLGAQALQYLSFWIRSTLAVFALARPGDIVVAMTDPPLLGVGAAFAARLNRAGVVQWCQDIYPEVALALTPRPLLRALLRLLRPVRNWSWQSSQACVVPGTDVAKAVVSCALPRSRLHVLPNWAPEGLAAPEGDTTSPRRAWAVEADFVVVYSGNLGRVHDFTTLLAVADVLQARTDIVFLLIGGGARRDEVAETVRLRGLANVRLLPAQPRAQLGAVLAAADLHVITLRSGCEGLVWPSKFYGIMAAQRPVLYLGPRTAEVATTVQNENLGACFTADEVDAAAQFVSRVADDHSYRSELQQAVMRHQLGSPGLAGVVAAWERVLKAASGPCPLDPIV